MALTLVAVPIGNIEDITLRALNSLKEAELYIGEERKPMFRLLKELGVATPQNYQLLNEHSTPQEIKELAKLCKQQNAVLVTDCGTPGFSDPGAELVAECRRLQISVTSNPGPSSLTTFLSLTGKKLPQFHFEGFLPRDTQERLQRLKQLDHFKIPVILMDTPYRLTKTLQQCSQALPERQCVLGMDLTRENETFIEGSAKKILGQVEGQKREFLLLIL